MSQCTNCWSWHTHGGNCGSELSYGMIVIDQPAADEIERLTAQLAQRDGELEALRETVHGVRELVTLFDHTAVYDLKSDILAALSDNPESPALTDKEA